MSLLHWAVAKNAAAASIEHLWYGSTLLQQTGAHISKDLRFIFLFFVFLCFCHALNSEQLLYGPHQKGFSKICSCLQLLFSSFLRILRLHFFVLNLSPPWWIVCFSLLFKLGELWATADWTMFAFLRQHFGQKINFSIWWPDDKRSFLQFGSGNYIIAYFAIFCLF